MKRILLHLHPQGAYLRRAIDYAYKFNEKSVVYPISCPTFLNNYNNDFSNYLKHIIPSGKEFYDNFSFSLNYLNAYKTKPVNARSLESISHYFDLTFPFWRDYLSLSIVDTISRNLVSSSLDYFKSSDEGRRQIFSRFHSFSLEMLQSYMSIFMKIKPDVLIVSHMNYIYYTTPILASLSLEIPVVLIHGGYHETIVFNNQPETVYASPSEIRQKVFDFNLGFDGNNPSLSNYKVFPTYKSITDVSNLLMQKQSDFQISDHNRTIIINHQIISEVCTHFYDPFLSSKIQTRYDMLKHILDEVASLGSALNVILRLHPVTHTYPEERQVIQSIVNDYEFESFFLLEPNQQDEFIQILHSINNFPEIYCLGGHSLCELIGSSIEAYSLGKCFLPSICQQYILRTPETIHNSIHNPSKYRLGPPSKLMSTKARSYVSMHRNTHLRESHEDILSQGDKLYHFGNNKDINYPFKEFLSDSINKSIIDDCDFWSLDNSRKIQMLIA